MSEVQPLSAKILYRIMLNVMEESGIYEIPMDLETVLPTHSLKERLEIAQNGLSELYRRQWLEVWQADWPDINEHILPDQEVLATLAKDQSWTMPTNQVSTYFRVIPTDFGIQAWKNGGWNGA